MKRYLCSYKSPGAIFFGVCGGKLSEGIDFSDDMARLVIIVGIPFGYMGDSRNKSKMEYHVFTGSRCSIQAKRQKMV
jgi:Rad3-related DNA helicase